MLFLMEERGSRTIGSFKHKGLKKLFPENQSQGLPWEHVPRLQGRRD